MMMAAVVMASVHEKMHEWARCQGQVRKKAEQVRLVFGEQIKAAHRCCH
jgi:hypothetical protein